MDNRWKPSVTVAALIERAGKFMLVEEQTSEGLKLNNPAGHLEPGESLIEACVREALEETTFHFTPTALVGVYMSRRTKASTGEDITYLRFAFCGELGAAQPGARLDTGIERTLWMSSSELRACQERHRSPLLMRCVDDYLGGQRLPLPLLYTDPSVFS